MERYIAGPPKGPVELPPAIEAAMLPGDVAKPVWRNELGGLTFRLQPARVNPCSREFVSAGGTRFAKWSPGNSEVNPKYRGNDLHAEAERLRWASDWVEVPEVLDCIDVDGGELLVTQGIEGRAASSPFWCARPEEAARAIGKGLRAFHDALPVAECPFSWSVAERVKHAGLEGTPEGDALIAEQPPMDDDELVVCHGDACAPNYLLSNFGYVVGFLDLGRLGVGSRWADLAVAAWSTDWNYGPGYEDFVYQGYGIKPTDEKIAYYRRLWDAT